MAKIQKAFVKNVKGVREIEIVLSDVTEIAGQEATGKSSFVDAILWALMGTRPIQEEPIRKGEDNAEIILETEDLIITRRFHKAGDETRTTLTVRSKADGAKYNQTKLDQIFDNLVDPSDFFALKPQEVVDILRGFLPAATLKKLVTLENTISEKEEERLNCSRDLKRIGQPEEVEKIERVSVTDLLKQREEIVDYNREQERLEKMYHEHEAEKESVRNRIKEVKEEIARQQAYLDEYEKGLEELEDLKCQAWDEKKSTEEVDEQIRNAEDINAGADAYERYLERKKEYDNVAAAREAAQEAIDNAKSEKTDLMAKAKLPVSGVKIDGDDVTVDGKPIDQLSTSEKMLFGARIAMSRFPSPDSNGRIRTLFIRHGESLGQKSFKELCKLAKEYNYQLVLETVGEGHSDDAIVLEEGAVLERK